MNQLVGQKVAIVSDKPQTTRNRILAVVNRPEGQIVLFDTPGIHKPMHRMNERMVDSAVKSLGQVDVALWVVDVTESYGPGDRYVRDLLKESGRKVVLALNKIDAIPKPKILAVIEQYRHLLDFADVVPVSALNGDNVDVLAERLLAHLPEGEALYPDDFLTDLPERFFVAEMVREKILRMTRDELPYSTGVVIDSFQEGPEHRAHRGLDPRRARHPEGHRHRQGRLDAEGHRHRGAPGHRGVPGGQGVPGAVREGARELARGRRHPRGDGPGRPPQGMMKVPFDVGDAELRDRFLGRLLPEALAALREDARPAWGAMTAQQMVEHLAWVFEISIGEASVECSVPEERRARWKAFLFDATPMPREFRNPALVAGLPFLRHAGLAEAKAALSRVVDLFLEHWRAAPAAAHVHPTFGPLLAEEWSRSHFKHVYHHLLQFRLIERDGGIG